MRISVFYLAIVTMALVTSQVYAINITSDKKPAPKAKA